ncbi:hypothetical protein V5799_026792 [Amblyomma americanum]|uniref:Uncharacterized protein n=1 Tax=Amblyomma americanum TaxID=6943 RepID=A0AAQ4DHK1_AMBAM
MGCPSGLQLKRGASKIPCQGGSGLTGASWQPWRPTSMLHPCQRVLVPSAPSLRPRQKLKPAASTSTATTVMTLTTTTISGTSLRPPLCQSGWAAQTTFQ